MEMDYEQTNAGSEKHSTIDDASMHTITATSMQQPTYDVRPQTSYSDTGFSRPFSQSESGTPDQLQNGNGLSRPPSTQSQPQYGQDGQRQQAQKNASVVIKVGMVGDAQIGKTSLMVKYVEGSWDEDYIQTLGISNPLPRAIVSQTLTLSHRREFHGEDD
jgi:GTP-binding protein of the ras superfamily involved in termination of M-phase